MKILIVTQYLNDSMIFCFFYKNDYFAQFVRVSCKNDQHFFTDSAWWK